MNKYIINGLSKEEFIQFSKWAFDDYEEVHLDEVPHKWKHANRLVISSYGDIGEDLSKMIALWRQDNGMDPWRCNLQQVSK